MLLRSIVQQGRRALAAAPDLGSGLAARQGLAYDLDAVASSCAAAVHSATPAVPQRQFASPSGGPPQSKLRAIPFTITPFEAQQTFEEHHATSWLHKQPSGGIQKMKEAFLPFWVSSALLRSHLHSAEIGREGWTQVFNPQTRRFEQQLRMHYQQVAFDVIFEKQYTAEEEGSAVYASYKYPRSSIKALAPGGAVLMAKPFTPDMVQQASGDGSVRRVGPFEMRPGAGAGISIGWYQQRAWRSAAQWIKDNVECDDVRSLHLEHTVLESRTSPVYIPAYIFRSRHLGDKLHTFVSGCVPGRAAGTHVLNEARIGGLAGAAVTVGLVVSEAWKWAPLTSLLWWWVAPAALVAAAGARFWPALSLQLSRAYQARQRQQAAAAEGPWDEAFVAAFDPDSAQQRHRERVYSGGYYDRAQPEPSGFEDFFRRVFGQQTEDRGQQQQQRQRDYQRQQQQQQQASRPHPQSTGDPRDPLGHYKRLGVNPGCSKDEIQAAFRGQAQKWHPDHVDDPAKKAEASKQFRLILESYTVLRDAERRRQYDRGIY